MMETPAAAPTAVRYRILALCCMVSWFLYLHRYSWNVVNANLQETQGYTNEELGWLSTLFQFTYGLGQIPSGMLCDRIGTHLFLTLAIVAWSLISMGFAGVTGKVPLGGLRLGLGLAQSGVYPNLAKVTRNWFPPNVRTIMQGWIATCFGRAGAAMMSIIMVTFLMGYCGLSITTSLVYMGLAGVAFAAVFFVMFRGTPEEHPAVNPAEAQLISAGQTPVHHARHMLPDWTFAQYRSLAFLCLAQAMMAGADMFYSTQLGTYALNAHKLDLKQAGWVMSLPLWGGAIGGALSGLLNDSLIRWFGNRRWARCLVGGCGSVLACLPMILVVQASTAMSVGLSLFVVRIFTDLAQPTVWGASTDLGKAHSATVFATVNSAGSVAGLLTPILFGRLLDYNTTTMNVAGEAIKQTNYSPLFVVIGCMYLVSGLCWLGVNVDAKGKA